MAKTTRKAHKRRTPSGKKTIVRRHQMGYKASTGRKVKTKAFKRKTLPTASSVFISGGGSIRQYRPRPRPKPKPKQTQPKTAGELRARVRIHGPALRAALKRMDEAKREADRIRPEIRAIEAKILRDANSSVKSFDDLYLIGIEYPDEDVDVYYDQADKEYRKAGYNMKPGYSPLLIAESKVSDAKWAVIDAGAPITGLTSDDVAVLEHRDKLIKILRDMPNK